MAASNEWIKDFGDYLDSLLDPSVKSKVKQEYIQWVKARDNYYAALKDTAPEFLELLAVIEKHLGIRVEIETDGKSDKPAKSKGDVKEPVIKEPKTKEIK
jgi:hypothetical protein